MVALSMARPTTLFLTLALVACGSDGNEPTPVSCATGPAAVAPQAPASQGSLVLTATGTTTGTVFGRATVYQQGQSNAAYSVLSGYMVDTENRPASELFLLLRSVVAEGEQQLVPVTLDELQDPQFFPAGAIAAYAEGESFLTGEYQRWFVAESGCIRITESVQPTPTTPGRVSAIAAMQGEWRLSTGALVGEGRILAKLSGPLLDLRSGVAQPADSMRASISGDRPGDFAATSLEAFQVLHPEQTRLVIVGTQAADTTREIWLSLTGVPVEGDSIELSNVTLEEARRTRQTTSKSFAMVRMLEYEGTTPVVRELWTSASGYVKFSRLTQNGPLALCGEASGRFAFTAQGTSLSSTGTTLGSIDVQDGSFKTRMTIVARSDTLVDPAIVPASSPRTIRLAAPGSTMGFGCP